MHKKIRDNISQTIDVLQKMLDDNELHQTIEEIVDRCVFALSNGNKLLLMGNGGSAADAQHIAAEFVSRFEFDRPGLSAIAITTDTSALTAIGNDYGYEKLFSRQIQAIGKKGDIVFGITTSGCSENVILGLNQASKMELTTVGLTGSHHNEFADLVDYVIKIPSKITAKIQEGHILVGHTICSLIERKIFLDNPTTQT